MSAETERFQAIRARWQAATSTEWQRLQHYNEAQQEFDAHARADIATLLAALDAAEAENVALQKQMAAAKERALLMLTAANRWLDRYNTATIRSTALQAALAQATHGYLHRVGEGTGYAVYHCRFCGAVNYDLRAPNHHAGCPVLVLTDSYREE